MLQFTSGVHVTLTGILHYGKAGALFPSQLLSIATS